MIKIGKNLPSCPELSRCSPRSHPKTLSCKILMSKCFLLKEYGIYYGKKLYLVLLKSYWTFVSALIFSIFRKKSIKLKNERKLAKSLLTLRMPRFFNLPLAGRERMKLRKKVISLPCFRKTGFVGSEGESDIFFTFHFCFMFFFPYFPYS